MPTSHSALEFMRRNGIVPTPRGRQPRLDTRRIVAANVPLERSVLDPGVLLEANGDPPPDRGIADLWPPPQEVVDEPNASEQ